MDAPRPEVASLDPRDEGTLRALLALDAGSFREDLRYPKDEYRRRLALPGCEVLAAREEGRVVGVAFGRPQDGAFFLDVLAVDPSRRRSGLGRALVEATVERARALGLPVVRVHAEPRDHVGYDLARFYRGLGFEVEEDHGDWLVLARPTGARSGAARLRG